VEQVRAKPNTLNRLVIRAIRTYTRTVGPNVQSRRCRFEPTCSAYTAEAFATFGTVRAARLSLQRLRRCNPLYPAGLDPVPDEPDELGSRT
jgi:hypothetical protein